ncbi:hypothetical protein PFICI_12980 [Pestalotiopsis fici W106-1]|uniref:Thioesterase domain-containing protein n=1 Tax=Pestalotiopsis fici (strain W106-1 / CGMCC3.15140) TaxID=1229662 RepID=W3WT82_PESFW|nr:uncharacterized protein PFICI_12980 [Pestalotiopsis fici W106-1]ETS76036.1 hypothetical protein PFICI_12980 [Pestalotiopsis fici W106-1]
MASFAQILKVTAIDSHSYRVNFTDEWCIGSVPNGGVVTSVLQSVAREHFLTTLKSQNQPDCISLHADFVQRTSAGPAVVQVEDLKLGRQTSTVRLTLVQEGRKEVLVVLTHANIALESGLSLPTAWRLDPPPPPADLVKMAAHGTDGTWTEWKSPRPDFRKASLNANMYTVRQSGRVDRGVVEQWIKLKSGENFTNTSLGFLSDMFPLMVESYSEDEDAMASASVSQRQLYRHWYPTLALNLDVKKLLPEGGAKWMFVRVQSKMIANGRKDLEVIIMDQENEIVALSHHVAMILDASRNIAKRGESGSSESNSSKL